MKRRRLEAQSIPVGSILEMLDSDSDSNQSNKSVNLLEVTCPWQLEYDPLFQNHLHCACPVCHGCQIRRPDNQICNTRARLFCPNDPQYRHKCNQCEHIQIDYCPMMNESTNNHCECSTCCACGRSNHQADSGTCIKYALKKCRLSPFYRHECTICVRENTCPYGAPYVAVHCQHAYEGSNGGCCGCTKISPTTNECLMPSQSRCSDSPMYLHKCEYCWAKFPWD